MAPETGRVHSLTPGVFSDGGSSGLAAFGCLAVKCPSATANQVALCWRRRCQNMIVPCYLRIYSYTKHTAMPEVLMRIGTLRVLAREHLSSTNSQPIELESEERSNQLILTKRTLI